MKLATSVEPAEPIKAGQVAIDSEKGTIDLIVEPAEMERRLSTWQRPAYKATRGTLYKYIKTVRSASEGCVTDE